MSTIQIKFYDTNRKSWLDITPSEQASPESSPSLDADPLPFELTTSLTSSQNQPEADAHSRHLSLLVNKLKMALQMPNIMVLAGSGTSLGPVVNGPSMPDLWDKCVNNEAIFLATDCFHECGYDINQNNIESCLSHCEAYIQVSPKDCVKTSEFVEKSKVTILDACTNFLKNRKDQLKGHQEFIRKLARRKAKDPRVKLFTTNYDTCFEDAASLLGLTVIDGFSFSVPRIYDARFFDMDIVRRNTSSSSTNINYLEGVFHLYKLHGSVNWYKESSESYIIEQQNHNSAENSCMIFPAKNKYQQSYMQPHLELMSRFSQSLREPNTCLIIAGFGFNDDHLSEQILSTILSNPHLKVIMVSISLEADFNKGKGSSSRYWHIFKQIADQRNNDDLIFINCDFQQFSNLIPDLTALSPAENLYENLKQFLG